MFPSSEEQFYCNVNKLSLSAIIQLLVDTFEKKNGAKITFLIFHDSCSQTIKMGWWSKFDTAHGLMERVDG